MRKTILIIAILVLGALPVFGSGKFLLVDEGATRLPNGQMMCPIGRDGQVLIADSRSPCGFRWDYITFPEPFTPFTFSTSSPTSSIMLKLKNNYKFASSTVASSSLAK